MVFASMFNETHPFHLHAPFALKMHPKRRKVALYQNDALNPIKSGYPPGIRFLLAARA